MGSRKKKKNHKKKLLINLSLLLVILGIVAGISLKSSYFFIKNIEIKNNKIVTNDEIEKLSQLKGKNIFLLNKENTVASILKNPYIENVEIARSIPSSVTLTIEEKKIGAAIKLPEGYVSVDENGKMVKILTDFPVGKIPIIKNIDAKKYIPNQEVLKNEDQKNALKACLKVLNTDKAKSVFSEIDVQDPFNVRIFTSSGIEANIGNHVNVEYRISLVISMLNDDRIKNKKGYIVAMDSGGTFKPSEESQTEGVVSQDVENK